VGVGGFGVVVWVVESVKVRVGESEGGEETPTHTLILHILSVSLFVVFYIYM
jgi:hypothetical protein